jgi:hypothetical protein
MHDLALYSQSNCWKHAKPLVEAIEPGGHAAVEADLGDLRPGCGYLCVTDSVLRAAG